jgi:hypothetical protein
MASVPCASAGLVAPLLAGGKTVHVKFNDRWFVGTVVTSVPAGHMLLNGSTSAEDTGAPLLKREFIAHFSSTFRVDSEYWRLDAAKHSHNLHWPTNESGTSAASADPHAGERTNQGLEHTRDGSFHGKRQSKKRQGLMHLQKQALVLAAEQEKTRPTNDSVRQSTLPRHSIGGEGCTAAGRCSVMDAVTVGQRVRQFFNGYGWHRGRGITPTSFAPASGDRLCVLLHSLGVSYELRYPMIITHETFLCQAFIS